MFRRRKKRPSFFGRLLRSFFAVFVLSALVLGVSLFAKEAYDLDTTKFANLTKPIATRLGISEEKAGDVAGEFVERITMTGVSKDEGTQNTPSIVKENTNSNSTSKEKEISSKIAIMSDSEDEFDNLSFALKRAKDQSVDYVFVLGDITSYGDIPSLREAKNVLDESGLNYSAIPGDHDIADSNKKQNGGYGLENFKEVFGQTYQIVIIEGTKFLLMDNSPNKTPLDEARFRWFLENVGDADFVLLSQPIYHPSPTELMGVMGTYRGENVSGLHEQALIMLSEIRNSSSKAVIAADHHMSSTNKDPEKSSLEHVVIGALNNHNVPLQRERFAILTLFEDGSYKIQDVTL